MHIQNRLAALLFRIAMLISCVLGIWLMCFQDGKLHPDIFIFYTNLSNLGCLLFFLPLTVKTALELARNGIRGNTVFIPRLKGAVTMMITLTFVVFAILLQPFMFTMTQGMDLGFRFHFSNILLHYITPLFVLFDWLLFDKKFQHRRFEPFLWLIIPYAYLIFVMIRAEVIGSEIAGMGSRYPYFFLDTDIFGWGGTALWVLGITIFFTALGYGLVALDRIVRHNGKLRYIRWE